MYISYDGEDSGIQEIVRTPGFITVNLRAAWNVSSAVSVFAGVKNLLDYVQEDRRTDDGAFIWGPYTGREIYGGASIKL
jgi:outer membrane receptor protein involved in Fe transport